MQTTDEFCIGKTYNVLISAFDRTTKYPVTGGTCTVDFFAPPKNPEDNPSDRVVDHTFTATFDSGQNAYTVNLATSGWLPGKWTYRVTLTDINGSVDWDYNTIIFKA